MNEASTVSTQEILSPPSDPRVGSIRVPSGASTDQNEAEERRAGNQAHAEPCCINP